MQTKLVFFPARASASLSQVVTRQLLVFWFDHSGAAVDEPPGTTWRASRLRQRSRLRRSECDASVSSPPRRNFEQCPCQRRNAPWLCDYARSQIAVATRCFPGLVLNRAHLLNSFKRSDLAPLHLHKNTAFRPDATI